MDSATNPVIDLQTALQNVEKIAEVAAGPFVKNPKSQATVQTIAAEVNLGIAALPLFGALFQSIANLFHHAHETAKSSAGGPTSVVAIPAEPAK